jgi:hypothetical protein
MVGTRSLSSGARSRDPVALPTLRILFVIASEAKQSRSKEDWIASSLRSSQ